MQDIWETVSSERHFANAHLEVVTEHVRTPSCSQPRAWTIVHRKAAVIIAPMTRDGKIVLIHQERIPIRTAIWEMPSGQIEAPTQETVEQVALRELREEADYELAKDGELIALGQYFTSPGFTDERGYFFLARRVQKCKEASAGDEGGSILDCREFSEVPESETSKPFLEHLEELRWMIVKMAITLASAMIVCFTFRSTLVRILQAPLRDVGSQIGTLKALGITDSIVISFHLAFYAGIVLSFPLLLYFIAEFVLPALTAVEKRFLLPAILVSFALFLLGVTLCYFWLLPKTILFFFRDTESLGWAPTWTVQQYYSFVTRFTIGFGLAFELPVVVLALVRFGLITYRFMARTRPYAVVLIFILATIITPTPDILTLVAMALPMCLLYESCIWIAWLMERRASESIPK